MRKFLCWGATAAIAAIIVIAETNARRTKRYAETARSSDVASAAVGGRSAGKFVERLTDGGGVRYQDDNGDWRRK